MRTVIITRTAWDLEEIKPRVEALIKKNGRPPYVVDTMIEEEVKKQVRGLRLPRLRFCIAMSLKACGYKRRSKAGNVWDRID